MLSSYRFCNRSTLLKVYFRSDTVVFSIKKFTNKVQLEGTLNQQVEGPVVAEISDKSENNVRKNSLGIQMLSSLLHKQIFKDASSQSVDMKNQDKIIESIEHLKAHELWGKETSVLRDVHFKLPELYGNNIDEHFRTIALQQSEKYREYATALANATLPALPKKWNYDTGWTKYNKDGTSVKVDFPGESALVFDIETLVKEGHYPTIATAVSTTHWYSWCSEQLFNDRLKLTQKLCLDDLIPLETKTAHGNSPTGSFEERIIIGHNVSFDRAFIKEQYFVNRTKTRFLDTMSLHIANAGLTGLQRSLLMAHRTGSKRKDVQEAKAKIRGPPVNDWMKISSLNSLKDVYELYCKGPALQKEKRAIFVKGAIADVRENFQELMSYCAKDVQATHSIFSVVLPTFFKRFPHPVTFAGLLEMGCAYLPVNHNWDRYINKAQSTYDNVEKELKLMLMRLANDACALMRDCSYKNDLWLWDLDWSVKALKCGKSPSLKKSKSEKVRTVDKATITTSGNEGIACIDDTQKESSQALPTVQPRVTTKGFLAKQPHSAGYPVWYRDLCPKLNKDDDDWKAGPSLISHQTRITPKLMRLTWDGYPLHYSRKNGWGYLVPGKPLSGDEQSFPIEKLLKMCPPPCNSDADVFAKLQTGGNLDRIWEQIMEGDVDPNEASALWNTVMGPREPKQKNKMGSEGPAHHNGNGPYLDDDIPGCWFFRLPHKDGPQCRVGNPLAKDFLNKIEDKTLRSNAGEHADWALKMSKMLSYWKNARKRITTQMVVWLTKNELPQTVISNRNEDNAQYGAILPRIVTSGTVTRRAVEPTWLTASNAYVDRIGSELKAMIQAFPGYHFVGADVDSQELWIAAILGDAHFAGIHGCTAFGWMTLQGKKSNATDMHSKTALTVGITRDQAKVMNYGRIYGAGQPFASRLLMQFNHRLTLEDAKSRARVMYASTKGVRGYELNQQGIELLRMTQDQISPKKTKHNTRAVLDSSENVISRQGLLRLLRYSGSDYQFQDVVSKSIWVGGTESAMFNKLEEIALSLEPKTPVLEGQISQALEAAYVMDNFMTSRVNWVVQSSAVDYLHLMLVSMRWLFDTYEIDGRFCISIHDEVRYIVKSNDRYRAALALQITNLLTRSMFAYKVGMNDLPQSVAFFSAIDIDTVLRKEVHLDCKTPSNTNGVENNYGIPQGEAVDIYSILEKTNGQLSKSKGS